MNSRNKATFGFVSKNTKNTVKQDVKELVTMVSEMQIDMVTKINMAIATKSFGWWLDSGATIHVWNNKEQFKVYEKCEKPKEILMGNNDATKVIGKGNVYFKTEVKIT